MNYYYLTEKFTLIPDMFFSRRHSEEVIRESHILDEGEIVKDCQIKSFHAHIVYAIPERIISEVESGAPVYPLIVYLIDLLNSIQEYNKVIFYYSRGRSIAQVIICKGDRLQLVNSYSAPNFESAAYFLFLALKQTIVNPLQTKLSVCCYLHPDEKQTLETYFQQVHITPSVDQSINLL